MPRMWNPQRETESFPMPQGGPHSAVGPSNQLQLYISPLKSIGVAPSPPVGPRVHQRHQTQMKPDPAILSARSAADDAEPRQPTGSKSEPSVHARDELTGSLFAAYHQINAVRGPSGDPPTIFRCRAFDDLRSSKRIRARSSTPNRLFPQSSGAVTRSRGGTPAVPKTTSGANNNSRVCKKPSFIDTLWHRLQLN